jgi:hypothetical protein
VHVDSASGTSITFHFISGYGPSGNYTVDMADPNEVNADAPNDVTAAAGSEGFLFLTKTWLVGHSINISPYGSKWPLTLGLEA